MKVSLIIIVGALVAAIMVYASAKKKGKLRRPTSAMQIGMAILVGTITINSMLNNASVSEPILYYVATGLGILVTIVLLIQAVITKRKEQTENKT